MIEYYSAIKRRDIVIHAMTRTNPENILSERPKAAHTIQSYSYDVQTRQICRDRK